MIRKFFFILLLIGLYLWFATTNDKALFLARAKSLYEFVLKKSKSLKIEYNYSKQSKKNNRW